VRPDPVSGQRQERYHAHESCFGTLVQCSSIFELASTEGRPPTCRTLSCASTYQDCGLRDPVVVSASLKTLSVLPSDAELRARAGTDGWTQSLDRGRSGAHRRLADVTEDHQWIHVDPGRASEGAFGSTIAHGWLILSLMAPFTYELLPVETGMAVNYGVNRVRFLGAVPSGSRIRATFTVETVRGRWHPGRGPPQRWSVRVWRSPRALPSSSSGSTTDDVGTSSDAAASSR
jgi:acyl dehydratase